MKILSHSHHSHFTKTEEKVSKGETERRNFLKRVRR